jgi:hypothetical protein
MEAAGQAIWGLANARFRKEVEKLPNEFAFLSTIYFMIIRTGWHLFVSQCGYYLPLCCRQKERVKIALCLYII